MNNVLKKLKAQTRYQALHQAIINGWIQFTDKAKEIAGKRGAIPIALVDGSRMVDRMIAQRLGIAKIERIKWVSTYSILLEDITYTNGDVKEK